MKKINISKKNRLGFTLIEVLSVMVIMAIIAVITLPIVSGVMEKSRRKTFENSVLNGMQALSSELAANDFEKFPIAGVEASSKKLGLEKNAFISGLYKKPGDSQNLFAFKVYDGRYCATGYKNSLEIVLGPCYLLDKTAPDMDIYAGSITSRSVQVIANANDEESDIVGYQYSKDNGASWTSYQKANSYNFDMLTRNTSFNIKVRVKNENSLVTEKSIVLKTNDINVPTYTSNPSLGSWSANKVVTINYPTRQTYYIYEYSLNGGSTWETVSSGTSKVITFTTNGTITARVRDGYNVVAASVLTITNIDNTPPTIPTSVIWYDNVGGPVRGNTSAWTNRTLWWGNFSSYDSGSGINRYEYSSGCSGSVSSSLNSLYQYSNNTNYTFCIRAVDNMGYASGWSSPYYFNVDKSSPSCTSSGGGGWTTGNRYVSGSCNDPWGSGCQGNISRSFVNEIYGEFSPGTVYDYAGNSAYCPNQTVAIDRTPPMTPMVSVAYPSGGGSFGCNVNEITRGNIVCNFYASNSNCSNSTIDNYSIYGDIGGAVNSGYQLQFMYSCSGANCFSQQYGQARVYGSFGYWKNIDYNNIGGLNFYAGKGYTGNPSYSSLYVRAVDGAGNISGTLEFRTSWCV